MYRLFMRPTFAWTALGIIWASPGFAQTGAGSPVPAPVQPAAPVDSGDDIIVTAQRREQSVQDVGIAISAFSGEDLRQRRITSSTSLDQLTPNLDIKSSTGGYNPVFTIRGIGLNDQNINNNPTVSVYIDDVFMASPAMSQLSIFDIQRIEILKGPQGTLYGRNSTGGAINFITAKPTRDVEGLADLNYTFKYDRIDFQGTLSGPLTDALTARASLSVRHQGESYFSARSPSDAMARNLGSSDSLNARLQFRYETGGTKIDLAAHLGRDRQPSVPFKTFGTLDPASVVTARAVGAQLGLPAIAPLLAAVPAAGGIGQLCASAASGQIGGPGCVNGRGNIPNANDDPYEGYTFVPDRKDRTDTNGARLGITWEIGDAVLVAVTGYETFKRRFADQTGAEPNALFVTPDERGRVEQISQEVRLSGSTGGFTWLVGAFGSHDAITATKNFRAELLLTDFVTQYTQKNDTLAVFTHDEFALTPTLTLVGGLRFTHDRKTWAGSTVDTDSSGTSIAKLLSVCGGAGTTATAARTLQTCSSGNVSLTANRLSFKAGLEFKPSTDVLMYANISRAFKSGGVYGHLALSDAEIAPFEPETLLAYEIGLKTSLLDRTLTWNTSAFYYDYTDVQTFQSAQFVLRLANVDTARVFGAETELNWRPVRALRLGLGIGVLDSKLGDFILPTGLVSGNRLPHSPSFSANGSAEYTVPVNGDLDAIVQVTAKHASSMFSESDNDPLTKIKATTIVNATASLDVKNTGLRFALWVSNLTGNENYQRVYRVTATSQVHALAVDPRTIGFTVGKKF